MFCILLLTSQAYMPRPTRQRNRVMYRKVPMTETNNATSRRTFLKDSGHIAGATTLAGITLPLVHAAESNTIQLALVGCAGRRPAAVADGARTRTAPTN